MVGDLVNYRPGWVNEENGQIEYESGTGFPVRIEFIYKATGGEGLVQYNDGENNGIEAAEYELFPIPVTPEILEKNGFDYMGNCHYDYEDGYGQLVRYDTFNRRLKIIRDLDIIFDSGDYAELMLHELQHALKLCRIDLQIKIE